MSQHATAADYSKHWSLNLDLNDLVLMAQVNLILVEASSVVDANIAAAGGGELWSATAWGADYLKLLTTIFAGVAYSPAFGPQLTAEMKKMWLDWLDGQFERIRSGEIDPSGATGAGFPAFGSIEHNLTPWSGAQIIMNRMLRRAG